MDQILRYNIFNNTNGYKLKLTFFHFFKNINILYNKLYHSQKTVLRFKNLVLRVFTPVM